MIANRSCADCKMVDKLPEWFSCLFFITLCDKCANVHFRFLHQSNRNYYIIEINKLYKQLNESSSKRQQQNYCDTRTFLKILRSVGNEKINSGNEKINSLLEFQSQLATNFRVSASKQSYIIEKYLNRRFINLDELDDTINFIEELNRRLVHNVASTSLIMTIYYLFLGASVNFVHQQNRTVLDYATLANQKEQASYLTLNNAYSYSDMNQNMLNKEHEGYLVQIYDINQSSTCISSKVYIWSKLKVKTAQYIRINSLTDNAETKSSSCRSMLNYTSIIKVNSCERENTFEIKWCHQDNNSLISSYYECENASQIQLWLKRVLEKCLYEFVRLEILGGSIGGGDGVAESDELMSKSELLDLENWFVRNRAHLVNLIELIDYCQINLFGYLNQMNNMAADADADSKNETTEATTEKVFLILLETSPKQINYYCRPTLILVRSKKQILELESSSTPTDSTPSFYEILDLRKLVSIKKTIDSILIEMTPNKSPYVFKYNGYSQNLDIWFERIQRLSRPGFKSIEDQYLAKNDVPILVEKCCSFIELNCLDEKGFYSNVYLANTGTTNNKFMSAMSKSGLLKETCKKLDGKQISALSKRLEEEREFELTTHDETTSPIIVLNILRRFLSKHVLKRHSAAFNDSYREILVRNKENNTNLSLIVESINRSPDFAERVKRILRAQSKQNSVYFNLLKRVCMHLHLIAQFKKLNEMDSCYLANIFSTFLFYLDSSQHMDGRHHRRRKPNNDAAMKALNYTPDLLNQLKNEKLFFIIFLEALTDNFGIMFDVKQDYLAMQTKMIEKSIYLKNLLNQQSTAQQQPTNEFSFTTRNLSSSNDDQKSSKFLLNIYLFSKKLERSFLVNVNGRTKCRDILELAKLEFKLDESKYWCLFEVFDNEQLNLTGGNGNCVDGSTNSSNSMLVERILPVNCNLIETISTWATFYLCIKSNHVQIELEKSYLTSQSQSNITNDYNAIDICEFLSYSNTNNNNNSNALSSSSSMTNHHHHLFRSSIISHFSLSPSSASSSSNRRWKTCNISIQNALIKIHKIDSSADNHHRKSSSSFSNDVTTLALIDELRIEDCLVYYGFYDAAGCCSPNIINNGSLNGSSMRKSLSKSNLISSIISSTSRLRLSTSILQLENDNELSSSTSTSTAAASEKECLTIFSKETKNVYCIHFESREKALTWYFTLFKLAFYPDTWTYFKQDHLPTLKQPEPLSEQPSAPTENETAAEMTSTLMNDSSSSLNDSISASTTTTNRGSFFSSFLKKTNHLKHN
ncbi:unnamed protein product [Sphagnum balticum]